MTAAGACRKARAPSVRSRHAEGLLLGSRRRRAAHILRGPALAVGPPSRRAEQVIPPLAPGARPPQIVAQGPPFVEVDDEGIVGEERLHEAVAAGATRAPPVRRAGGTVEDSEPPAVVGDGITGNCSMV